MGNINKKRNQRIGEIKFNKDSESMEIIEYINYNNITVKFKDGYITNATYGNFKNGNVRNPYSKTIYGIAYIGEGKYKSRINNKRTPVYTKWQSMLRRCYNEKLHKEQPTYINCTVCEEWRNFQNFGSWFDNNYYEIDEGRMHLDKDILHKGNKIYSPKNCIFVPQRINCLFVNRKADRGEYPLGIGYDKQNNKYSAKCSNENGETIHLGCYNTVEKAFNVYKEYKEKIIKSVADEYKDKIPQKLYNAMYNYIIEITD